MNASNVVCCSRTAVAYNFLSLWFFFAVTCSSTEYYRTASRKGQIWAVDGNHYGGHGERSGEKDDKREWC